MKHNRAWFASVTTGVALTGVLGSCATLGVAP